jgi:hypothetical protein
VLDHFIEFSDSPYSKPKIKNKHIPETLNNISTRFEDLSEDIAYLKQKEEITENYGTRCSISISEQAI